MQVHPENVYLFLFILQFYNFVAVLWRNVYGITSFNMCSGLCGTVGSAKRLRNERAKALRWLMDVAHFGNSKLHFHGSFIANT